MKTRTNKALLQRRGVKLDSMHREAAQKVASLNYSQSRDTLANRFAAISGVPVRKLDVC